MEHIGRIKVVKTCAENEMEAICICPHCGKKVLYGNMSMVSGIHCCPNCNLELNETIEFDKKNDYEAYTQKANNHKYEPYRYTDDMKDIETPVLYLFNSRCLEAGVQVSSVIEETPNTFVALHNAFGIIMRNRVFKKTMLVDGVYFYKNQEEANQGLKNHLDSLIRYDEQRIADAKCRIDKNKTLLEGLKNEN